MTVMSMVGMDRGEHRTLASVLEALVSDLDKRSDFEVARTRLRAVVTAFVREGSGPSAVLSKTAVWVPSVLTEDEKVAFALEVAPRLKRKLPVATWRGLNVGTGREREARDIRAILAPTGRSWCRGPTSASAISDGHRLHLHDQGAAASPPHSSP